MAGTIKIHNNDLVPCPPLFTYFALQLASKYDSELEHTVLGWFKALLGIEIRPGIREVEKQLRNGVDLVK